MFGGVEMKLIVGLGNPGREYQNTRHNIGFQTIDKFACNLGIDINKSKFNGLYMETLIDGEKIILLKPQSYINLSGEGIRKFVDFYKISISDILVIHDDMDLKTGQLTCTTLDSSSVKKHALSLCTHAYIVADSSKSKEKGIVTFAYSKEFDAILTTGITNSQNIDNIINC